MAQEDVQETGHESPGQSHPAVCVRRGSHGHLQQSHPGNISLVDVLGPLQRGIDSFHSVLRFQAKLIHSARLEMKTILSLYKMSIWLCLKDRVIQEWEARGREACELMLRVSGGAGWEELGTGNRYLQCWESMEASMHFGMLTDTTNNHLPGVSLESSTCGSQPS